MRHVGSFGMYEKSKKTGGGGIRELRKVEGRVDGLSGLYSQYQANRGTVRASVIFSVFVVSFLKGESKKLQNT